MSTPQKSRSTGHSHTALDYHHHLRTFYGSGRNHNIGYDTASLVSVTSSIVRPEQDSVSKWKKKIMC